MRAFAAATAALVSAVTAGPDWGWVKGLSPVFFPTPELALYLLPVNFPATAVFTMSTYIFDQSHSEPVIQPLGASDDASAWYPTVIFPAASVALITVDVQSWCWVITSTPWLSRLRAASA